MDDKYERVPEDSESASNFCTFCWRWQRLNGKLLPSFKMFIFLQARPYKLSAGAIQCHHRILQAMRHPHLLSPLPTAAPLLPTTKGRKRKSSAAAVEVDSRTSISSCNGPVAPAVGCNNHLNKDAEDADVDAQPKTAAAGREVVAPGMEVADSSNAPAPKICDVCCQVKP